jgi:hypothetical protein
MVVPKENKRRLKEWRKARKRDLEAPPPDGVATWQRMDESQAEAEEEAAAAKAAAEREALRLPPPVVETPTPPPGVNLAPPGPDDWRNELGGAQEETPLLGFLDDDEPPKPLLEPAPLPTDPVDHPTAANFTLDEPTPLVVPGQDGYQPPAYQPTTPVEPPSYDPTAFDPDPTFDTESFDPISLREAPAFEPPSYQPTEVDPVPAFEPSSFAPPAFEPAPFEPPPNVDVPAAVFEPTVDPLASSFGPPSGVDAPPPAYEPVEDVPLSSFGPPPVPVDPADAPPLPPATSLADFGLGDTSEPTPMAFADDPPPPAAAPPAARPTAPELASAPIRPRTPTRIPAAKPSDAKGDAKDMLARIAALRSDKDD